MCSYRAGKSTIGRWSLTTTAQLFLFDAERTFASDPAVQIVQVSVEKMQALRTAYPNYYLDTSMFNEALKRAIAPATRKKKKKKK
jgi:hypothetical protein